MINSLLMPESMVRIMTRIIKNEFYNNEKCIDNKKTIAGGPRIIWDVNNDTYQYIIPSNIDHCGCYLDGGFRLYYSYPKDIPLTEEYLNLKSILFDKICD